MSFRCSEDTFGILRKCCLKLENLENLFLNVNLIFNRVAKTIISFHDNLKLVGNVELVQKCLINEILKIFKQ